MKHYRVVTADNGLDIAITGPRIYRTFPPEADAYLKEMRIPRLLDNAYEAGLAVGGPFRIGNAVKWSGMEGTPFTVIGITKTEVLLEGDYSGVGVVQSSWVPIGEVTADETK